MHKSRALFRVFPAKVLPAPALHGQSTILRLLRREQMEYTRCLTTKSKIFHKKTHKSISTLHLVSFTDEYFVLTSFKQFYNEFAFRNALLVKLEDLELIAIQVIIIVYLLFSLKHLYIYILIF